MKFVPKARAVNDFLYDRGYKVFDPFKFKESTISAMIDLMRRSADAPIEDYYKVSADEDFCAGIEVKKIDYLDDNLLVKPSMREMILVWFRNLI